MTDGRMALGLEVRGEREKAAALLHDQVHRMMESIVVRRDGECWSPVKTGPRWQWVRPVPDDLMRKTKAELIQQIEAMWLDGSNLEDALDDAHAECQRMKAQLEQILEDDQEKVERIVALHEAGKALLAVMAGAGCYHDPDV